jgi:hypothetical protein
MEFNRAEPLLANACSDMAEAGVKCVQSSHVAV